MASIANSGTKLTLKYPDKKSFTFSKFQSEADNESLYEIAKIVNSFQDGPMQSVIKTTTQTIL